MTALKTIGTWELVDLPPKIDVIGTKWAVTIKYKLKRFC